MHWFLLCMIVWLVVTLVACCWLLTRDDERLSEDEKTPTLIAIMACLGWPIVVVLIVIGWGYRGIRRLCGRND